MLINDYRNLYQENHYPIANDLEPKRAGDSYVDPGTGELIELVTNHDEWLWDRPTSAAERAEGYPDRVLTNSIDHGYPLDDMTNANGSMITVTGRHENGGRFHIIENNPPL